MGSAAAAAAGVGRQERLPRDRKRSGEERRHDGLPTWPGDRQR